MTVTHYWWEGDCVAFIACGSRAPVRYTNSPDKVTCLRCRKTWRYRNNGVVPRGH